MRCLYFWHFRLQRLPPVFSNSVLHTLTAGCQCIINCCIGRFYGRCPYPQFLKKLSKLFCFWEDNLALAKFQSPTDTPLNHNLSQLSIKNRFFLLFCSTVNLPYLQPYAKILAVLCGEYFLANIIRLNLHTVGGFCDFHLKICNIRNHNKTVTVQICRQYL